MKKLWTSLAVLTLAGALCVPFAACGQSGSGSDALAKAKAFRGAEVTEEQWDAAFEALKQDNSDLKVTIDCISQYKNETKRESPLTGKTSSLTIQYQFALRGVKNGAQEYETLDMNGKYAGDKSLADEDMDMDVYLDYVNHKEEWYGEQTDDGYFVYEKDETGRWTREEGVSFLVDDPYLEFGLFVDFGEEYDEYIYDAEQKGYVPKYANRYSDEYDRFEVLKFDSEGRFVAWISIASGSHTMKEGGSIAESSSSAFFYTYQAENITLPQVA